MHNYSPIYDVWEIRVWFGLKLIPINSTSFNEVELQILNSKNFLGAIVCIALLLKYLLHFPKNLKKKKKKRKRERSLSNLNLSWCPLASQKWSTTSITVLLRHLSRITAKDFLIKAPSQLELSRNYSSLVLLFLIRVMSVLCFLSEWWACNHFIPFLVYVPI